MLRIEEAFATPEIMARYRTLIQEGRGDPGFRSLMGFYGGDASPGMIAQRLQDLGELRLRDMDESGIARQIVSLTAPLTAQQPKSKSSKTLTEQDLATAKPGRDPNQPLDE